MILSMFTHYRTHILSCSCYWNFANHDCPLFILYLHAMLSLLTILPGKLFDTTLGVVGDDPFAFEQKT